MDEIRIEPFDRSLHVRTEFRCGIAALDRFLHTYVTQYEKRRLGKTFVAVLPESSRILGYYTLAAAAIACDAMPVDTIQKLPKHPVPVVLLARLAVDTSMQGQGLGCRLLMDAFARTMSVSRSLGVHAVEVVAIDDQASGF